MVPIALKAIAQTQEGCYVCGDTLPLPAKTCHLVLPISHCKLQRFLNIEASSTAQI
jgi:hypothetical protein